MHADGTPDLTNDEDYQQAVERAGVVELPENGDNAQPPNSPFGSYDGGSEINLNGSAQ